MLTAILTIIIEILKFLNILLPNYYAKKEAEKQLFLERFKTITDSITKATVKMQDALNEDAYLSLRDKDFKDRFAVYKKAALDILTSGGGLNEICAQEIKGMGIRAAAIKPKLIIVLTDVCSLDDKAGYIAKALCEYKAIV